MTPPAPDPAPAGPPGGSFHELIDGLRAGDPDAAQDCFERYARRLVALARSRLGPELRPKLDAEDVVQSVFNSFFARQGKGEFELGNWGSLWGVLVVITLRKCGRYAGHYRAGKRDVDREFKPAGGGDDSSPGWEAVAREPGPEEAAALTELVRGLLDPLPEREREIVTLRLQGYTVPEISGTVGRTERTVHRVLARVRERLDQGRTTPD